MNHNLQLKINKVYKNKLNSNDKLILTKKFVRKLSKEIKFKQGGISKVRIFSNGDFSSDMNKALIEINNIFNLAKVNPFVKFWLITRSFETLYAYIPTNEIPGNLNKVLYNPKNQKIGIAKKIESKKNFKSKSFKYKNSSVLK